MCDHCCPLQGRFSITRVDVLLFYPVGLRTFFTNWTLIVNFAMNNRFHTGLGLPPPLGTKQVCGFVRGASAEPTADGVILKLGSARLDGLSPRGRCTLRGMNANA